MKEDAPAPYYALAALVDSILIRDLEAFSAVHTTFYNSMMLYIHCRARCIKDNPMMGLFAPDFRVVLTLWETVQRGISASFWEQYRNEAEDTEKEIPALFADFIEYELDLSPLDTIEG